MATPVILAICGAVMIAMGASFFGVGIARMFWADDLRETKRLETYWKSTVASQAKTIEILEHK